MHLRAARCWVMAAVLQLSAGLVAAEPAWYMTLSDGISFKIRTNIWKEGLKPGDRLQKAPLIALQPKGDSWQEECWVQHPLKYGSWHPGHCRVLARSAASQRLEIIVDLPPQSGAVGGGRCQWTLELTRDGDTWLGTYTGEILDTFSWDQEAALTRAWGLDEDSPGNTSSGTLKRKLYALVETAKVAGAVLVDVVPAVQRLPAATSSGHPQLFFNKKDLPALRAKMEDPVGKQLLSRIDDILARMELGFGFGEGQADLGMQSLYAAALGLKYQLTGDKRYALQAIPLVWDGMYQVLPNFSQWRQSHRILGVAVAYDLCVDAWDPAFVRNVYNYLLGHAARFAHRSDLGDLLAVEDRYAYGGQEEAYPRSESDIEGRKYQLAAGLAALAILGDEPPVYDPPPVDKARKIPAASDYRPLPGVPIVQLRSGDMFERWLLNGPFPQDLEDPLTAIGGLASARPIPGTRVELFGVPLDFRHYLPAGHRGRMHIYPRDCKQYYLKSTGNGYWPGQKVHEIAKQQNRRGVALTWYTVWDNPDSKLVQCFPNLRWQSHATRMWLNGVEVFDDEVVAVEPGLYPVMVHIPVVGGYTTQAPHLRWYGAERQAAEAKRAERQRQFLAQIEGGLPRRLAQAIGAEVRRFLLKEVDSDGWNAGFSPDHLMPFLYAYRRLLGEDLAADTGVRQITPLACLGRDLYQSRDSAYVMSHQLSQLPENDRPVAHWYLQNYPLPFGRPIDFIVPFVDYQPGVQGVPPAGRYPLVQVYRDHATVVFNRTSQRQAPAEDLAVRLIGAAEVGAWPAAGALEIGGGTPYRKGDNRWIESHGNHHESLRSRGSIPYLQNYYNNLPAQILDLHREEDGSGSVSLQIGPLFAGRPDGKAPGNVALEAEPLADCTIRRSVLVDYSGASGAPSVVIVCDRYQGAPAGLGKFFQIYGGVRFGSMLFQPGEQRFRLMRLDDAGNQKKEIAEAMQASIFIDGGEFEMQHFSRVQEGHSGIVQVAVDRRQTGSEAAGKVERASSESRRGDDEIAALLDIDAIDREKARTASSKKKRSLLGGSEDFYLYVVLTFGSDKPPKVDRAGTGATSVISVGSRQYAFDGDLLRVR